MKTKFLPIIFTTLSFLPALALADSGQPLPEPSTLALYGSAALAIILARKLRG